MNNIDKYEWVFKITLLTLIVTILWTVNTLWGTAGLVGLLSVVLGANLYIKWRSRK